MKINLFLILAFLMVFAGCKTQKMASADDSTNEKYAIEKETDIAVEVDGATGIMSLEESFTFDRDEDKSIHDEKAYFVIIGSFRSKANADGYKETLIAKGFEPVILLSETGLHRVSVDSYAAEDEARKRILDIRSRFSEHEDTWLLIRK